MSVSTTTNIDVTEDKRAWRVTFETPKGGPYKVIAHQEIVQTKDGETTPFAKVRQPDVEREVVTSAGAPTAVAVETVTLEDGTVLSMAQILEAGSKFSDKWRAQDEAASS